MYVSEEVMDIEEQPRSVKEAEFESVPEQEVLKSIIDSINLADSHEKLDFIVPDIQKNNLSDTYLNQKQQLSVP